MKKTGWIVITLLICCLFAGCSQKGTAKQAEDQTKGGAAADQTKEEDSHITMVKKGCPANYPDSPYGEVFEKYFENPSWGYFEAKDEKGKVVDIVEFTGNCEFEKADYKAQVQFTVDEEKNSFDATYLALDGEAQTMTKLQEFLTAVYAKEGPAVSGEIGVPAKDTAATTTAAPATTAPPVTQAPAPKIEAQNNYYILPYSGSYRLTKADISHLTKSQLKLARNEIYARHGRMFKDDDLQNYFNSQLWYTPIYSPGEFKDSWLSDVESDNISFIQSYE